MKIDRLVKVEPEKLAEESLKRQKSARALIIEAQQKAQQNVTSIHRDRRHYLRGVLKGISLHINL